MKRPWMPLYVADYLADTGHLSTTEHGAYMLLIMHYWQNDGLPADDAKLARIARMPLRDWSKIGATLADFFDDGWKHKRIEEEFARAKEKSDAARESAEKRWGGNGRAMRTHVDGKANGNAKRMLSHSPSPIINNFNSEEPEREFRSFPPDGSIAYSEPFASIARKARPGVDVDVLASGFRKFCYSKDIPFDDPKIEVKWGSFCLKHKPQGLHS